MSIDPAISAIRMAATLSERFGAVIRDRTSSLDAIELQIGEANQIYPEIWRYMDEARAVFERRGVDVSGYDGVRATEPGKLGVTNVEVIQRGDQVTKIVTFNLAGLRTAHEALRQLKSKLPEVDWAALDRADRAEIAAMGSLTAANWKGLARSLLLLGALIAAVALIYKLAL